MDTVCKYLAEEKYDEANKLQEEYYEIENEYDLFDQTYEEHGKLGIKDITGKILVPAIYSNYSELYSYTIKRGAPVAAQNDEGKFALVSTNGSGLPLCDFIYDLIVCKHYTSFYTCIKEVDGKRLFGLLTAKGITFQTTLSFSRRTRNSDSLPVGDFTYLLYTKKLQQTRTNSSMSV